MACDVRQAFAHGVDDVADQGRVFDVVDSGVDGTAWRETQRDRRVGDHFGEEFGWTVVTVEVVVSDQSAHAENDPTLKLSQLVDFGRDVGWNTTREHFESQTCRKDILEGTVVQVAANTLGEISDAHNERKYARVSV